MRTDGHDEGLLFDKISNSQCQAPNIIKLGKENLSEVLRSPEEQGRHYRYNVTLNCVRSTTAAVEKQ